MTNKLLTNGFARVQERLHIPLADRVYVAEEPKKPRPYHPLTPLDDPVLTASELALRDTTKPKLPGDKWQMVRSRGQAVTAVSSLFRAEDMTLVIHRGNP